MKRISPKSWSVLRELSIVAFPLVLTYFGDVILSIVDTLLIGRYSTAGLAAVGAAIAVIFGILIVVHSSTIGLSVIAGRLFGAEKDAIIGKYFVQTAYLTVIFMTIVALILGFYPSSVSFFYQNGALSPETITGMENYLSIRSIGLVIIIINSLLNTILSVDKKTYWIALQIFILNGLNVLFSYPLIYGVWGFPELGVSGAAIGANIADSIVLLITIGIFVGRGYPRKISLISREQFKVNFPAMKEILIIGLPVMVSVFSIKFANNIITIQLARFGDSVLATSRILELFIEMLFLLSFGFAHGVQILTSRYTGAQQYNLILIVRRWGIFMGLLFTSIFLIFFIIFPNSFISIFTSDPEITATSGFVIYAIAISGLLIVFAMNNIGILRGSGETRKELFVNLFAVWILHMPVAWLLISYFELGLVGVFSALIVYWSARGGASAIIIYYKIYPALNRKIRKLKTEKQEIATQKILK